VLDSKPEEKTKFTEFCSHALYAHHIMKAARWLKDQEVRNCFTVYRNYVCTFSLFIIVS